MRDREKPSLLQERSSGLWALPPQKNSQCPISVPRARCDGPGCSVGTTGNSGGGGAAGLLLKYFLGAAALAGSSICPVHMFSNLPPNWELCLHSGRVTVYCQRKEAGSVLHFEVLPSSQVGIPRQPAASFCLVEKEELLFCRQERNSSQMMVPGKRFFSFKELNVPFFPPKINESYRIQYLLLALATREAQI